MRSDILGILKNAVDRGEDVRKVGQSLANAGYPIAEVQAAMDALGGGVIGALSQSSPAPQSATQKQIVPPQVQAPRPAMQPAQTQSNFQMSRPIISAQSPIMSQAFQMQQLPSIKPEQPQHKGKAKLIILTAVLLVLIAALTAAIMFKDKIISLFS